MYQFKLQIPISFELKEKLKQKAKQIGFSSVNEVARLLLTNFAKGSLNISFIFNPKEEISDEELKNVVTEGISEYKKGKTKKLNFSKNIHDQLMED